VENRSILRGMALVLVLGLGTPAEAQETALQELSAAARAARNDGTAQAAYGRALLRAGRYREAQVALQAAARLSRRSPAALYDVATVAFARGDYRAARSACGPLQRARDGAVLARVCNARAFLVWNRSARAFEELEAALAIDANNYEALLALGDAHRLRAVVTDAEAAYRRAVAVRPDAADPHVGLGLLYAAAERRDDAIRELRAAAGLDRTNPEISYQLGKLLVGTPEARQLLEAAVSGRPSWAEAQSALGDALLAAGDATAARQAFAHAIELNAQLAEAHSGLGRALLRLDDLAAAEAALRRALELVPNAPGAVGALAAVLARTDRLEEAFEQYGHAADLDPRNPQPLLAAARLAVANRRDVLAAGFLDRILQQQSEQPQALALYGDIMLGRGDRTRARQYYERALRGRLPAAEQARLRRALGTRATRPRPRR